MIFTQEERDILTGPAAHLCIRGPRASGRTAAMLLAAEHAIGHLNIPAWRVLMLFPERTPGLYRTRHEFTNMTIQRLTRRAPALQGVRSGTTSYLNWLTRLPHDSHFMNHERSRYSLNNHRFWEDADNWQIRAQTPTGTEAEEKELAIDYLYAARDIARKGYRKASETERHLLTASRLEEETSLGDFDLILVDDLHLFDPQDLPLFSALLRREAPMPRVVLTLQEGHARGDIWWSRLADMRSAYCTLRARAVRQEVLDLLEAVSPQAQPLVCRMGAGGQITTAPFQQLEDRRSVQLREYQQQGHSSSGQETTAAFGHHLRAIQEKAHREGQDLAVIVQPGLALHEVRWALDMEDSPFFFENNAIPAAVADVLRLACGLARPGGGHPLYTGHLPLSPGGNPWLTSQDRNAADRCWATNQPLLHSLPFAALEEKLTDCKTTQECLTVLHPLLSPLQQRQLDREQLPEDVFEALGQVMARLEEPRLMIGSHLHLHGSWTHVAFVYDSIDLPEQSILQQVVQSATHSLTFIPIRSPPGAARRRMSQSADPVRLLWELSQKPAPNRELLQDPNPPKDTLLTALRRPGFGDYLRYFAPHHLPPEQFHQWQQILGSQTPAPWLAHKEPARPWHHQVTLLEEQQAHPGGPPER